MIMGFYGLTVCSIWEGMWFQQDCATCHTACEINGLLREKNKNLLLVSTHATAIRTGLQFIVISHLGASTSVILWNVLILITNHERFLSLSRRFHVLSAKLGHNYAEKMIEYFIELEDKICASKAAADICLILFHT